MVFPGIPEEREKQLNPYAGGFGLCETIFSTFLILPMYLCCSWHPAPFEIGDNFRHRDNGNSLATGSHRNQPASWHRLGNVYQARSWRSVTPHSVVVQDIQVAFLPCLQEDAEALWRDRGQVSSGTDPLWAASGEGCDWAPVPAGRGETLSEAGSGTERYLLRPAFCSFLLSPCSLTLHSIRKHHDHTMVRISTYGGAFSCLRLSSQFTDFSVHPPDG